MNNKLLFLAGIIPLLLVPLVSADQVLTKYASTPDNFADGNAKSIQVTFASVKKVTLGHYGNQFQMQGTIKNTSGHDIANLDINAMLIDAKGQNVGMVPGIATSDTLTNGQSTSFSGIANEDSKSASAIAFKNTFGWQ